MIARRVRTMCSHVMNAMKCKVPPAWLKALSLALPLQDAEDKAASQASEASGSGPPETEVPEGISNFEYMLCSLADMNNTDVCKCRYSDLYVPFKNLLMVHSGILCNLDLGIYAKCRLINMFAKLLFISTRHVGSVKTHSFHL